MLNFDIYIKIAYILPSHFLSLRAVLLGRRAPWSDPHRRAMFAPVEQSFEARLAQGAVDRRRRQRGEAAGARARDWEHQMVGDCERAARAHRETMPRAVVQPLGPRHQPSRLVAGRRTSAVRSAESVRQPLVGNREIVTGSHRKCREKPLQFLRAQKLAQGAWRMQNLA